jgi:SAM-dependent methyltransferase
MKHAMDLDELSRSPDGQRRVTVTARALLLTRDVAVQESREEIYHPERGHSLPYWDHDTTFGGLGLTTARIDSWKGRRVLDLASGLGLAATELSTLGALVDCVDLELGDDHPSFAKAAEHVKAHYAPALARLRTLSDGDDPRYQLPQDVAGLLARLMHHAKEITAQYPAVSGSRRLGNAVELADVDDASYDATLCGWLMVHLDPDDEQRALRSMLRVTKPGGHIHVRAGYGADAGDRIAHWFASELKSGSVALLLAHDDLIVLQRSA